MPGRVTMGDVRPVRPFARHERGQVVLGALLVFLPMLVLVLSLLNTQIVAKEKARRQLAADAAALSGLALEARAMNIISVANVTITYLVAEALAEEAFRRSLGPTIAAAYAELVGAEAACGIGIAPACAAAAALQWQIKILEQMRTAANRLLPPTCAFPGGAAHPMGGSLFKFSKLLEEANTAVQAAALPAQLEANQAAEANGVEGAVLWPAKMSLPVHKGGFHELGDPIRYGSHQSADDFSERLQRGYHPLLGLGWNHGPLTVAADNWRTLLALTALGVPGAAGIYNLELRAVYADWFGYPREEMALPRPMMLDGLEGESDIDAFRVRTFRLAVAWEPAPRLFATNLFRLEGETRYAYAQAEIYNGTSWDLLTQDWRVRLVPASLLESSGEAGEVSGGSPPAGLSAIFHMPVEVARWLNTH